jgi:hypothetical protein
MRLLGVDEADGIFHVAVYGDFFPDVESAEAATADPSAISLSSPHIALTERAFQSTQVAAIGNRPLTDDESERLDSWINESERQVSDRSVRLMLGIR